MYRWSDVPKLLALVALYALLILLVLSYLTTDGNISPVWLPSGLGLAALMAGGKKYWPGIFVGALAAYLAVGRSFPVSFFIAVSNVIEPLLALWLLALTKRFDPLLRDPRDYLWLIFIGALVAILAASIGIATLLAAGILPAEFAFAGWMYWWRGNLFGIALVAPFLLIWRTLPASWARGKRRLVETVCFIVLSLLTSMIAFHGWTPEMMSDVPLAYLMFLFVIWGAVRFGRHGVMLILLLTAIQGVLGALDGVGFFASDIRTGLANFWLFTLSMTFVGIVLATSIRQQRLDAQALGESEARLHAILDHAPVGIWFVGTDGRYRFVNKRFCNAVGIPETAFLLTEHLPDLLGEEIAANCQASDRASLAQDEPYVSIEALPLVDGKLHQLEVTKARLRDARGEVVGTIGISVDVTARKQAEEALRESEARWSFALEGGGDCVWDWNLLSNEVSLSKGGKGMFGFADDEIGNHISEWNARVHPEDVAGLLVQVSDFFHRKQDKFMAEYRVRCKDDSWKWILTRGMVSHRGEDGRVTRMIGTHTDLTERKQAEETIRRQAHYDALTQLPNRRLFRDRLEQTIRLSRRDHSPFALMLIDLDHFKEVNDTMGHDAGDFLLVDAAQRILHCVRESDTVARMGGDEFVVILPDIDDPANIERIAQKIIGKLASPFLLGEEKAFISASIGITLYPSDADSMETLLKNADQAMYVAKSLGRNRMSYFTPVMQENAQKRMRLVNDLRDALAFNQFQVYYQPIVELATGDIHKAEALLRWIHPTRGMVSPAEFIPLAEETGMIVEIGDWVLQQAMQQVKRLQASHHKSFQISVNKSPVQFHNDNPLKAEEWLQEMERNGLHAGSLVVEITEGVLLDDAGNIKERLLASRDAGIQVAIDDFGTGYSSLAYLKKFDIDYLKIDQTFVNNLGNHPDDMALCEAIIVMAHKLGLKVIAEGVETEQQRLLLLDAGCDYAQGFLFSKAIPADEFETLLRIGVPNGQLPRK
ncbi:MAG: EAL domain-containing protein [Nitrosomonadales bacterium]|nr:EAL domain-containing protein [Nitrosomonadales bacterium]